MPRWSTDPKDKIKAGRGTLRKHAVSKVWYFHYRDANGTWRSKSTGHRDRKGATDWSLGYSLELTQAERGIFRPDQKVTNDSIRTAAKEWLAYIQYQRQPGTFRTYTSVINNLTRYLDTRPSLRRLDQFNEAEVLKYREWLLKGGDRSKVRSNQKKTVDNNLVALRAFFNYCVHLKKVRSNPVRESKSGVQVFYKERRPEIETYTRSEYARIIQHASPELRQKCRFLAASGLRIDELAHLEVSDIDLDRGWLNVRVKKTHDGIHWSPKDKTDRKLPLNDELLAVIEELLPGADDASAERYLFPSAPGKHRAKNFARRTLNQLKGLSKPTGIPKKKLTSHNFRRYFVSQCADAGIDILCVMLWVGHDDWEMVRRYYRLRDDHAQASMRRFTTGDPYEKSEDKGCAATQCAPAGRFGEYMGNDNSDAKSRSGRKSSQGPAAM